jgi:hypothetical protein
MEKIIKPARKTEADLDPESFIDTPNRLQIARDSLSPTAEQLL